MQKHPIKFTEDYKKQLYITGLFLVFSIIVLAFADLGIFDFIRDYDIGLSILSGLCIILWCITRIKKRNKIRNRIRKLVHFTPPEGYTAAEIAVLDQRGPTGKIFPAMLYERIANGNIRIGEDRNGELFFEKITENPVLFFDSKFLMTGYQAYNLDPEHDFREMCFKTRNRVYLKMINRLPELERLPNDFFYKIERECTDRRKYKNEKRYFGNIYAEAAYRSVIGFSLCFLGFMITNYFSIVLGIWSILRAFSLCLDNIKGSQRFYLNKKGEKLLEEVRGFKKYLLAVDSEKLKVVLKEDPLYFEKILPYAIAFGIGDSRAEKCFQHIEYRETGEIVSEKMYNDSLALQPIFSNVVDLPSFIRFMNYYYKTKKDKTLELSTLKKNKEVNMIKTMQEYSNKKELYKKYL